MFLIVSQQATAQVYPPKSDDEVQLTRLQERLRKKLGANAYPFKFEVWLLDKILYIIYLSNFYPV